jgi:hypothetical protein
MANGIRRVCEPYTDPDGRFRWPEVQAARDALASRLFGAGVVQAMDSWLRKGLAELAGLGLNEHQQRAVGQIIGQAISGAVFSLLVHIDQFPAAVADVVVDDADTGERLASVGAGEIFDLHDRLGGWVGEFSDHPERYK